MLFATNHKTKGYSVTLKSSNTMISHSENNDFEYGELLIVQVSDCESLSGTLKYSEGPDSRIRVSGKVWLEDGHLWCTGNNRKMVARFIKDIYRLRTTFHIHHDSTDPFEMFGLDYKQN
jgi:hypothetical protein